MNDHLTQGEGAESKRLRLLVQAVFYSACVVVFGIVVAVALYHIIGGELGYLIMFLAIGFLALLTGYHAQHYLRDLKTSPVVLEGEVMKKWHKANVLFFFMPSYYIYVAERDRFKDVEEESSWGKIFTIRRQEYGRLLEDDLVRITCYPHSLTIEQLELYSETYKKFVPVEDGANS